MPWAKWPGEFTVLRGWWPFEDELPLEIQLSWIWGAVWGQVGAQNRTKLGQRGQDDEWEVDFRGVGS